MSISASSDDRGQWGSKLGFIMAAAGSAVGLGNIWRFPYVTGENGGAAFVLVYLVCVFLIGVPLLYVELALGRASGRNPVGAFQKTKPGTPFMITGILCLMACFFVLTYYGVIAGWTISFAWSQITQTPLVFSEYIAKPGTVLPVFAGFIALTIWIVSAGVEKGIEKWSKILMPVLFVMMLVIIGRSLTLEGASKGISYYLNPDFSKIDGKVVLMALGQAFFSLSVGWGLMITYGSYMPKSQNIVSNGLWVASADTLVAILAGFMVFPAVFAFGMDPGAGPGLTFVTLPKVFAQMTAGWVFGAIFFCLLSVAAVTSSISMLEVPVSYFVDDKPKARKKAAIMVGIFAFLIGIPSAMANGGSEFFSNMELMGKTGFLDIMDQVFGTLCLIVISLSLSIYVGWIWKTEPAVKEISEGCPWFTQPMVAGISPAQIWAFFVKYICPVVISLVLVNALGLFDKESPEPAPKPKTEQAVPTQTSPEDNASSPSQ
jgi:NSS family neurotransmitter:Na+ symporter